MAAEPEKAAGSQGRPATRNVARWVKQCADALIAEQSMPLTGVNARFISRPPGPAKPGARQSCRTVRRRSCAHGMVGRGPASLTNRRIAPALRWPVSHGPARRRQRGGPRADSGRTRGARACRRRATAGSARCRAKIGYPAIGQASGSAGIGKLVICPSSRMMLRHGHSFPDGVITHPASARSLNSLTIAAM